MNIGLISDLHAPYASKHALDFIYELDRVYEPEMWICLGDEIDGQSWSYHNHDADLYSPGNELSKAKEFLWQLEEIIPEMKIVSSNHGDLFARKIESSGLPRGILKSQNEIYEIGKGWKWSYDLTIKLDNKMPVYIHHGKSSNVLKLSQSQSMSAIQGHYHNSFNIQYWANSLGLYWGMNCGCLIDPDSLAFAYGKNNLKRPIIGTGMIIDDQPKLVPMVLDKRGRWNGKV